MQNLIQYCALSGAHDISMSTPFRMMTPIGMSPVMGEIEPTYRS